MFGSAAAFAARTGSQGEDDGYLITMTTDMNADRSECLVFDAALPGWRDAGDPAGAVGLAQA